MAKPFIRNPYNYDVDQASVDSGLECKDKSLTLQSQAQEADINVMLKRFAVTGLLPQVPRPPTYRDFDGIFDYRSAMDVINAADRSFKSLPAAVRSRFGNDPATFLEFCCHEENLPELRRLGLAEAEKPSAPVASADPDAVSSGGHSAKKRAKSEKDE